MMIDQVHFKRITDAGRTYEIARIWVCGIPFSADLSDPVERTLRRLADEKGFVLLDTRAPAVGQVSEGLERQDGSL